MNMKASYFTYTGRAVPIGFRDRYSFQPYCTCVLEYVSEKPFYLAVQKRGFVFRIYISLSVFKYICLFLRDLLPLIWADRFYFCDIFVLRFFDFAFNHIIRNSQEAEKKDYAFKFTSLYT